MSGLCNRILLALVILIAGAPILVAASFRWVHLGTLDAGLVNLAIDGKIAYREMPPGKATPWGKVPEGSHRFQVGTAANPGASFDLDIPKGGMVVVISVSDDNGDIRCRTVEMHELQGQTFVFNAMPGVILGAPESRRKAIFGKGFRVAVTKDASTLAFADSEGMKGELDLSLSGDKPAGSQLAILSCDDDGKPLLSVLRERDSFFEIGDQTIRIPDEFLAMVRIVSERQALGANTFNPSAINWENVDSQIFWLNLTIGREPCRLEIGGFPAMRRIPPGRGSGFVKWPAGGWSVDVVVETTNEKMSGGRFSLSPKSGLGIISSGGGKYPYRLLTLEGRRRNEAGTVADTRIRFTNALPDGMLASTIRSDTEPMALAIKPGETSGMVPLPDGFPGAVLDLTLGEKTRKGIINIPPMPSVPPGDWVVVVHLDQESFAKPVLTWVEMDKGTITVPSAGKDAE